MSKTRLGELSSTGAICQLAQQSPQIINQAIAATGGEPAVVLNSVRYYDTATVQAALGWLRQCDQKGMVAP